MWTCCFYRPQIMFLLTFCQDLTCLKPDLQQSGSGRVQLKRDGTWQCKEGKRRGKWQMEWVASTLYTTSGDGVSSITTADVHTSAASSQMNWCPCWFKWTRPFRWKTKSGLCACAITFDTQSTSQAMCHKTQTAPDMTIMTIQNPFTTVQLFHQNSEDRNS